MGWMSGMKGCGGDGRWEEKKVLRMGGSREEATGVHRVYAGAQSSATPASSQPPSRDPRASAVTAGLLSAISTSMLSRGAQPRSGWGGGWEQSGC